MLDVVESARLGLGKINTNILDLPELAAIVGFLDPLSALNIILGQMKVLGSIKIINLNFRTGDLLLETTC